ncbi:MAG: hypothetical protein K2L45_04800 [Muribaculaceae bacterium]|nr:hypothetical protein [Muribaculaceae bacterium]
MDISESETSSTLPRKKSKKNSMRVFDIAGIAMLVVLVVSFAIGCNQGGHKSAEKGNTATGTREEGPHSGTINGHEWIDLGLPSGLKWATCNVGANIPEESGNYYSWGETESKEEYTSINSLTYKVSSRKLKKSGIIDDSGILTKKNDAASVNWGEPWRMPTIEEFGELIDECTWNFASFNGVNGYLVTGPNDKNIFLPAAGFIQNTTEVNIGDFGDYWSSSIEDELSGIAHSLGYSSKSHGRRRYARYAGRTIRPVTE